MAIVGPLPILPVDPPAGINLAGTSGLLLPSQLVAIGPRGLLHYQTSRAWNALAFKCMAIGLPLTYTYGGTYRNYADQVSLFHSRYETPPVAGRATKTWNGSVYSIRYVNGKPLAMAAVPGTSNHGFGLAVDTAFDSDPKDGIGPDDAATITSHPQWPLFKQYVLECGFSWETTSEPWHIRLVTGDHPTPTVLAYEAFIKPTTPEEEDEMKTALLYRDKRYWNQWLIGVSAPVHLTPVLLEAYTAAGVPAIVDVHDQLLHSLLFQCGLTMGDLVPSNTPNG